MTHGVLGLHHVTATVDDAQADLDLCVATLGLHLVKTTVNFDNRHVYHFYYGDTAGTPGTIWTTFPYKGHGVPQGRKGAGQVTATALSVPHGALSFWRSRLLQAGVPATDVEERFGEPALAFADESGLDLEIIASTHDSRAPWTTGATDRAVAIRGLHSVTLSVREAGPTLDLLVDLGWTVSAQQGRRTRLVTHGGGAGRTLDVVADPGLPAAANGLGTVHHVAMTVATADEQLALRARLIERGCKVTEVRDRCYFTSIYFREPGGVLIEIATAGPGFAIDEPSAALGTSLKLPPWEEPNRRDIEHALPAIRVPAR